MAALIVAAVAVAVWETGLPRFIDPSDSQRSRDYHTSVAEQRKTDQLSECWKAGYATLDECRERTGQ